MPAPPAGQAGAGSLSTSSAGRRADTATTTTTTSTSSTTISTSSCCVLIGSQHSLYTAKLRAYLAHCRLPFAELTASAHLYRQVILPRCHGVALIPVLVLPGGAEVLQDSYATIRRLEQEAQHCHGSSMPASPRRAAAAQLLELYGDEWGLVLPAMHFRWSFPEQRQRLNYQFGSTNAPTADVAAQMAVGAKVAARFAGMLPGLGITPASIPAIEARFRWLLPVLQEHFCSHAYLLGGCSPTHADWGMIGPLAGHLAQDAVPRALLQNAAPLLADYADRLSGLQPSPRTLDRLLQHCPGAASTSPAALAAAAAAGSVAGAPPVTGVAPADRRRAADGPLMMLQQQAAASQQGRQQHAEQQQQAADTVPPAMLLLLHHMFLEQVPVLCSNLALLKQWKQQQEAAAGGWWVEAPRFLGTHSFRLFDPATGQPGEPLQRAAASYTCWRVCEIAGWYRALPGPEQQAVQQLLLSISAVGTSSSSSAAATAGSAASSTHDTAGLPRAMGDVDAVAAFGELLQLAAECGRVERHNNRIAVWLDAGSGSGSVGLSRL